MLYHQVFTRLIYLWEKHAGATETSEAATLADSSVSSFNIVKRSEHDQTKTFPLVDFFKFLQGSFAEAAASQIQPVRTEPFLCVFLSNNLTQGFKLNHPPLFSFSFTLINLATASSVTTDLLRSSLLREENIRANCSPV